MFLTLRMHKRWQTKPSQSGVKLAAAQEVEDYRRARPGRARKTVFEASLLSHLVYSLHRLFTVAAPLSAAQRTISPPKKEGGPLRVERILSRPLPKEFINRLIRRWETFRLGLLYLKN